MKEFIMKENHPSYIRLRMLTSYPNIKKPIYIVNLSPENQKKVDAIISKYKDTSKFGRYKFIPDENHNETEREL